MTEFWFWCDIFDEKLVIVICPILSIYLFILCVSYQSFFTHFFPAWMTWHLCILADTFIHIEFRSIDQFMLPLEIKHMTLALNNWQLLLLFQNDWILTSESHIYVNKAYLPFRWKLLGIEPDSRTATSEEAWLCVKQCIHFLYSLILQKPTKIFDITSVE